MTKGLHLDMPTQFQILLVPYDSGHRGLRMGSGPEHFVDNGLAQVLESEGHQVFVETIETQIFGRKSRHSLDSTDPWLSTLPKRGGTADSLWFFPETVVRH